MLINLISLELSKKHIIQMWVSKFSLPVKQIWIKNWYSIAEEVNFVSEDLCKWSILLHLCVKGLKRDGLESWKCKAQVYIMIFPFSPWSTEKGKHTLYSCFPELKNLNTPLKPKTTQHHVAVLLDSYSAKLYLRSSTSQ